MEEIDSFNTKIDEAITKKYARPVVMGYI